MLEPDNRYETIHLWGKCKFTLTEFHPHEDECKFLLMKVIEQAIRDYVNLERCTAPVEVQYFETAQDFLFDDEYRIVYGGLEMSFSDILHSLNLEIDWFRERVHILKALKTEVPELNRSDYNKAKR